MTRRSKEGTWTSRFLIAAAIAAVSVGAAAPAAAEYRRSCQAWLEVRPSGAPYPILAYEWNVYNTVLRPSQVNEARRRARQSIVLCVRRHWAGRGGDTVPNACHSVGFTEVIGYPFTEMYRELRDDVCAEIDENRLDIDLILFIDGERGCVVDGGNFNPATRVDIALNYRIDCPVTEGGSWECIGEGCPGDTSGPAPAPASPAPAPAPAPAPSSPYTILPNVRLPGNDVGVIDVADGDWGACAAACTANDACHAWTYRNRFQGVDSVCLLKSVAGPQIPDTCCTSGIER